MNAPIVAMDVLSTLAFFLAAALALLSTHESPLITRSVRHVFAAAMMLYVFVGISNVLEHAGITAVLDVWEDYVEITFIAALAYIAGTVLQNKQLNDQANAARLMGQQTICSSTSWTRCQAAFSSLARPGQ